MSSPYYLCYEIEGVYPYIYSVPKLKYVVGGSLLLSSFDREAKGELFGQNQNEIRATSPDDEETTITILSKEEVDLLRSQNIHTGAGTGQTNNDSKLEESKLFAAEFVTQGNA